MAEGAVACSESRSSDAADWLHVICGPLPLIERIEKALLSDGVPSSRILSERFYYD